MNIADAGGLIGAAAGGFFGVDAGTGEKLIMDLGTMRDEVDGMLLKAQALQQPAQLGGLHEAQAVAKLNSQVAAGGDRSLLESMVKFRTSLEQAIDAVRQGMANYEQVEATNREAFERGMREREEARQRRMDDLRRGLGLA